MISYVTTGKRYNQKDIDETSEEIQVPKNDENEEISISYITTEKRWNWKDIIFNNIFAYNIAVEIIKQDEDLKQICQEM